ncbi:MAG: preprotein translocase subunit SecG [Gammaproteobacteria bacterium]|nr:preprotein translocase subunit SecG [Gammaproteobacteria bacterium]
MEFIQKLVLVFLVLAALSVIVLVIMQQGKGADAGAGVSGGASASLFGSSGSANFLSRATAIAATIFFSTCLIMAYLSSGGGSSRIADKASSSGQPTAGQASGVLSKTASEQSSVPQIPQ